MQRPTLESRSEDPMKEEEEEEDDEDDDDDDDDDVIAVFSFNASTARSCLTRML